MIQLNNTNIRYINLGSTPVEKAFLGDKLIFKTPPYILVWSDAEGDNEVYFRYNRITSSLTDSKVKNIGKVVNASNSPVRFDFPGEESGNPIRAFRIEYGNAYKIDLCGYDFSNIEKVTNMFTGSYSMSHPYAPDYLKEIVIKNVNLKDGIALNQLLYDMRVLEKADFSGLICNPGSLTGIAGQCAVLKEFLIPNVKADFSSVTINNAFAYNSLLETVDISGLDCPDVESIWKALSGEYTYLDTIAQKIGSPFIGSSSLKKVYVTFAFFSAIFCMKYATKNRYSNNTSDPIFNFLKTYGSGIYNKEDLKYDRLANHENFVIVDLEKYKDFIESLTA